MRYTHQNHIDETIALLLVQTREKLEKHAKVKQESAEGIKRLLWESTKERDESNFNLFGILRSPVAFEVYKSYRWFSSSLK